MVRTLVTRLKLSQAPHSFSIVYTGKGRERISTPATLQSLLASGKHSYSWSTRKKGEGVGSRGSCCFQSLAQKHTCTASCSDALKGNFPKSLISSRTALQSELLSHPYSNLGAQGILPEWSMVLLFFPLLPCLCPAKYTGPAAVSFT